MPRRGVQDVQLAGAAIVVDSVTNISSAHCYQIYANKRLDDDIKAAMLDTRGAVYDLEYVN